MATPTSPFVLDVSLKFQPQPRVQCWLLLVGLPSLRRYPPTYYASRNSAFLVAARGVDLKLAFKHRVWYAKRLRVRSEGYSPFG
jgi:hypothetical protein